MILLFKNKGVISYRERLTITQDLRSKKKDKMSCNYSIETIFAFED